MEQDFKFKLSFKGELIENSVDAFDVANTILAFSQSLHELADIKYGEDYSESIKININAFSKGSLNTDFLIFVDQGKDIALGLLPIATNTVNVGKEVVSAYRTYVDIKKMLKGKKPKKIEVAADNSVKIIAYDNAVININYNDLRALQSKTLAKNIAKVVQPLSKEDSLISEISVSADSEIMSSVNKEESNYLENGEDFQVVSQVKYKGIISKIDTKANSGYINLGAKRLPFSYRKDLSQEEFELLVESLRKKVQIYILGDVNMDYESNPRSMMVDKVQSDFTLFNER